MQSGRRLLALSPSHSTSRVTSRRDTKPGTGFMPALYNAVPHCWNRRRMHLSNSSLSVKQLRDDAISFISKRLSAIQGFEIDPQIKSINFLIKKILYYVRSTLFTVFLSTEASVSLCNLCKPLCIVHLTVRNNAPLSCVYKIININTFCLSVSNTTPQELTCPLCYSTDM